MRKSLACALTLIVAQCFCVSARAQRVGAAESEPAERPQLVVQLGHSLPLTSVAFSPDGRFVLTGSHDESARLWDAATGNEIRRFLPNSRIAWSVAFSPDGQYVLIGGGDRNAYLCDPKTGKEIRRFQGHSGGICSVAFSRDGRFILTGSFDRTACLWDVATGHEIRRFEGHTGTVFSVAFSPDGQMILTGSSGLNNFYNDNTARLWDAATGKEIRRLQHDSGSVYSVAFSPDGRSVLTGCLDGTARLWDVSTGDEIRRFQAWSRQATSSKTPVAFSPDGRFILTGSNDKTARLWDAATGNEIRRFSGHSFLVSCVAFSPDGRFILTGSDDRTALLWDVATGRLIRSFERNSDIVMSIALSPDGQFMLTGGLDKMAHLWNLATGNEIRRFRGHNHTVTSVAFSHDGRFMLTGSMDRFARLFDPATGREVRRFGPYPSGVSSVAFSPDGRYILTGSMNKIASLSDAATGREVRRFEGHSEWLTSVAFSPDGRFILTGSYDKTVRRWDAATGEEIQRFDAGNVSSVAYSPDGRSILIGSHDGMARLYDVSTGNETRRFQGPTNEIKGLMSAPILSVAFSPDGRQILTGGADGVTRLWDAATGSEVQRFQGHTSWVASAAFFPGKQFILTAGWDNTIRLWDRSTGRQLCQTVSFLDGNWVAVDPEGRFDTNNLDDIRGPHWIMPDDPMRALPLEAFMKDYYEPRLLARILDGEKFAPIKPLASLNRIQPEVKITRVEQKQDSPDTVSVTVEVARAEAERKRGNKDLDETGVYDLRLFRDGQLVGYWPESNMQVHQPAAARRVSGVQQKVNEAEAWRRDAEIKLVGGRYTHTFDVALPHRSNLREVTFTAYAFNKDRIRSKTDKKTLRLAGPLPARKGKAYLITVGVNTCENPAYRLQHAVNDAEIVSQQLYDTLKQTGDYRDVVRVQLISDEGTKTATKDNFKAVLDVLAGKIKAEDLKTMVADAAALMSDIVKLEKASPEDLVIISFSSHGVKDSRGNFYLLAYDTGKDERQLFARSISSEELSVWLRGMDAGDMLMVIDACHSGAVSGKDFKPGPMNSRGLGQLAYDKGMKILAATQADSTAAEVETEVGGKKIRGGLLTYALINEAIQERRAASQSKITATGWMKYGEERVPEIYEEVARQYAELLQRGAKEKSQRVRLKGGRGKEVVIMFRGDDKADKILQRPALFDFTRKKQEVVLVRF